VKDLKGSLGETRPSSRVQAVVDWFGPTGVANMGGWLLSLRGFVRIVPDLA
jgi:hypothetical protein